MPTIGGGDDFVWIGGPDEGLWPLVVVGDEAIDGGLEIDDAFEDAALEALSLRRPSTPSDMNRSCQRQTAVLLTPAVRMIVAVPSPSGRRQHNPGAPDVLLGVVAVIDDRLQALAISRAQIDGDASTHPADSHDAKAMGIPTRTLTSASIH